MRNLLLWEDQRLLLEQAIELSAQSINRYASYPHWTVSFSGGKDSTAVVALLAHLLDTGRVQPPESITVLYSDTRMELPSLSIAARQVLAGIPENRIGLSVSSWPFLDQYTYSSSVRDAGNNASPGDFFYQLGFILEGLFRVTIPGRWTIVHAKDHIVYGSETDTGMMEVYPFSDECVTHMKAAGWRYQGRIFIDTDVVRENSQTHRLTYGELRKDASKHGVGMPEYALLFRKPPTDRARAYSDQPVTACGGADYPLSRWQLDAHSHWRSSDERLPFEQGGYDYHAHLDYLAELDRQGRLSRANGQPIPTDSPWCWWDIQRMDVLNSSMARGNEDERHICPLQLGFIERCIQRWSNPGDVVLDYFAGIGSVPYRAVQMGRYGVGIELKQEYYTAACRFLSDLEFQQSQPTLFDLEVTA